MKTVVQLNEDGYVIGFTVADESPLEPGVYHIPRNCIDTELPNIPVNKNVKWNGSEFIFEDIIVENIDTQSIPLTYKEQRVAEYPNLVDQLDMLYWDKINGTNNWIDSITYVKNLFPKE